MLSAVLALNLLPAAEWSVVNDEVMGGVSSAQIVATVDGALRFSGVVRLDYNGGFASVRRAASLPADATGLVVHARGDANRYRLTVFTRDARTGWRQPFMYYAVFAAGAGARAELRFADFRASFRGRPVTDAPPLAAADVIGIGLMITKAEHAAGSGEFALELVAVEPLR